MFQSHFGDGSSFGLELEYVTEAQPLGTGGGIRNAAHRVRGDDVLVFNADVLSGVDLAALLDDRARREQLSRAGAERAQQFTWQASAEAHLASYARALADA